MDAKQFTVDDFRLIKAGLETYLKLLECPDFYSTKFKWWRKMCIKTAKLDLWYIDRELDRLADLNLVAPGSVESIASLVNQMDYRSLNDR